jgi:hypothetical protein
LKVAHELAMACAVEAIQAGPLVLSYPRLDAGSPFRALLGAVPGWDDIAWQFLFEDVDTEHQAATEAVRLANVPRDAGRIIDATLQRERRRPLILRRVADIVEAEMSEARTPAEEIEYRASLARQADRERRLDAIIARCRPGVRRASPCGGLAARTRRPHGRAGSDS